MYYGTVKSISNFNKNRYPHSENKTTPIYGNIGNFSKSNKGNGISYNKLNKKNTTFLTGNRYIRKNLRK